MVRDKYMIWDGVVYGLDFDGDVQYLHYREDLFDLAGIVAPVTWGDTLAAAMGFTRDEDGDGKPDRKMGTGTIFGLCGSASGRLARTADIEV